MIACQQGRDDQQDKEDEDDRWKSMTSADKYQIQQEYGRTVATEIRTAAEERGVLAGFGGTKDMADPGVPFMPDWDRQKHLCVVPCRARDDSHWRREMLCSTSTFSLLNSS